MLRRTIEDRLAGQRGTVTGSTTFTATAPDEVRWDESGTMTLAGRTTPVSRTLFVRRGPDGTWTVHFADGRVLHPWTWGERVDHACAPDDYRGILDGDRDRWTVRWVVAGPAKDHTLDSVLTRAGGRGRAEA